MGIVAPYIDYLVYTRLEGPCKGQREEGGKPGETVVKGDQGRSAFSFMLSFPSPLQENMSQSFGIRPLCPDKGPGP